MAEYTPLVDYPDYTQEFAISAVLVDMIPIKIVAQTIDKIRIDIVAQSVGNISVDIAAQTVGNISVDIAAQSVGNLAVDIKAATAKVSIKIDAADITGNLPIDIKAQTISTLGVDIKAQSLGNLAVDIVAQTLSTLKIDIAAQTLSQLNVNITAATATIDVNISAQTVNLNVKTAAGEKVDTIRLPDVESSSYASGVVVENDTETSVLTITGKGKIKRIAFRSTHDEVEFRFYVDGTLINRGAILAAYYFEADSLQYLGYTSSTPQIQLMMFNDGGLCSFVCQIPFEFNSSFEIRAWQNTGVWQSVDVGVIYNKVG